MTSERAGTLPAAGSHRPRVMFFNPSLYAVGGMQAWLAGLMPDLRGRGWDVWLALPTGPHNDAAAYLRNYPWQPHVLVDNPTCSRLGRLRGVERALAAVRPDVLVVANLVSAYRAVEDLRARGEEAPKVVACVHTLDAGIFADLERLRGVIDALVAPNRLIAAAGVELVRSRSRAGVLRAVPCERWRSRRGFVGDRDGELTLLFAHRLDQHQKRALDLVPLLRALAERGLDLRLEIVGSGPEEGTLRERWRSRSRGTKCAFTAPWIPPPSPPWPCGRDTRSSCSRSGRTDRSWPGKRWRGACPSSARVTWAAGAKVSCGTARTHSALRSATPRLPPTPSRGSCASRSCGGGSRSAPRRTSRTLLERQATVAWDAALRAVLALPPLPQPAAPPPIAAAGRLDASSESVLPSGRRDAPRRTHGGAGRRVAAHGGRRLPRGELLCRLAELDARPEPVATVPSEALA